MSNDNKKYWTGFIGSIALNIFLLAFILGRVSVFALMPPPPPFGGEHGMHGHMPPPPPHLFGPEALFTPQEMHDNFSQMKENFTKIDGLREAFAKKLKTGPVTKEEALAHFSEVDGLMHEVQTKTQEKAAEKISTLTPEAREHFADKLLQDKHDKPHDGPPPSSSAGGPDGPPPAGGPDGHP